MYELEFVSGLKAGDVIRVQKSLVAGRSSTCDIHLPEHKVSRQHANFEFDGQVLSLKDNGSSNGTYVNGERITETELKSGDVVRLGSTQIRVKHESSFSDVGPELNFFTFEEAEPENVDKSVMLSVLDVPSDVGETAEVLSARLTAVLEVSRGLADIKDTDKFFDRVLDSLFSVFPQADRGFLMVGENAENLTPKAMRQRSKKVATELKLSTSICRQAMETKQAILFNSLETAGFEVGKSVIGLGIRSAMTVPLLVGETVEGLLQVDGGDVERPFTQRDLELAVAVGHQVAIAVHNALLLKQVEKETTTRNNLMRFLPGPLVEQAVEGKIELGLGGRSCTGTIMFSDVVGFTRMSEGLKPEEVVALMNRYFDRMVPCISKTGGAIDKYIGDAIMAFWGVPLEKVGSAAAGAESTLAMQNALAALNSVLESEDREPLAMGIGLNSGPVVAGNIGSKDRTEYTLLGDTVNTTQRIEAAAGPTQVLVSAATAAEIGEKAFAIAMPPLRVKNKAEPLEVLSLRAIAVDDEELVLHLPVLVDARSALLIRRLDDESFILLRSEFSDVDGATLTTDALEWPGVKLGTITLVQDLATQHSDGKFVRSLVTLEDPTLAGLLTANPPSCELSWADMPRSAPVRRLRHASDVARFTKPKSGDEHLPVAPTEKISPSDLAEALRESRAKETSSAQSEAEPQDAGETIDPETDT